MNMTEVAKLLLFTHALDQRHDTDEIRVRAWLATLDQECPRMEYRWAQSAVSRHYAQGDGMLTVEHLIRGWKMQERSRISEASAGAHCGKVGCMCTHSEPCYKGWRDSDVTTSPCPVCRPEQTDILASMPPPGQRSPADLVRLRRGAA